MFAGCCLVVGGDVSSVSRMLARGRAGRVVELWGEAKPAMWLPSDLMVVKVVHHLVTDPAVVGEYS